ncbi:hypothetical protein [Streptomyces achromogenes]|uniref:hypothetical protein n=1 Tax=Streptomyces achromogenes TaxID=67255 RepID=UPI0036B436FD
MPATAAVAALARLPGTAGSSCPALPSQDRAALQDLVSLSPDLVQPHAPTLDRAQATAEKVSGTRV